MSKIADTVMQSGFSFQEELLLQALERQALTGRLMTMRGHLLNKLFVGIIRKMMLRKHIIFKTSLKMWTLFNQIVVFIFIIQAWLKLGTMTIMLKWKNNKSKNILTFV